MATSKSNNGLGQITSTYKIEKDIPVVGMGRHMDAWKRYPLQKMKVGDSFAIPENDPNGKPHLVQPAARNYNRVFKTNIKLVSRLQADGSRRVWRIE